VKDSPYTSSGDAAGPYLYEFLYQQSDANVSLMVRTSSKPGAIIPGIQQQIKDIGGNLPIFDFKTLDDVSKSQITSIKAAASVLGLLSVIGLVVGSIGIYGVTSYAFTQRRREIGIRMALGAQRGDILRLIRREGVSLAVVGIAIGVLLALGAAQFMSSVFFGVSSSDPIVFLSVVLLLGLVAIGASLVPALTAAKSDPVDALKYE